MDPAVSPETLARMVDAEEVRFATLGDVAIISRRMGADAAGKPVADWIRTNGNLILKRHGFELYDLRPETGLVPVPDDR